MKIGAASIANLLALVSVAVGIVIFVAAPLWGLEPVATRVLGLTIAAVALWVTGVVSPAWPAFMIFVVVMIFDLAPASVAFSGFGAGAAWLTFAGVIFGIAIHRTGLGGRLADSMLGRFGRSYRGAVIGTVIVGFLFCFMMPSSMGRCAILVPLVLAMADALGLKEGRRGRTGLVMAAVFGTVLSGYAILPAGIPTIIMAGAAESLYGVVIRFGPYMLVHFPAAGLLTMAAIIGLVLLLYPDVAEVTPSEKPVPSRSWSGAERRLAGILVLVLGLWTTDFLHGLSPAWVGLAGAIVCAMPNIGALDSEAMARDSDYTPWIFTVGIISLGAVIADCGLAGVIGEKVLAATDFEPGADAKNFATMVGVFNAIAAVATTAGVPPLLTPMASGIADAAGWPLLTVLMAHTAGQYVMFYPYQIPPILTGALLGRVSLLSTTVMGLCWTGLYLALIAPLSFFWWRWLGMFEHAGS